MQSASVLLLSLLGWSIKSAGARPGLQDRRLIQGEVNTYEIAGAKVDTYKISISGNQYFHIVVEQLGIAVIVALSDSTGAPIVQTHSQSGAYGPLYVSEIAPVAGDYVLRVRALDTSALAGRYQVTLETVRNPEPADRQRIAAEKALAEGQSLLEATSPSRDAATETQKQAIKKFKEAAEQFNSLKDHHGEVMSLHLIGVTHQTYLNELTEAKQVFSKAFELAKNLARNDWRLQATISNDLGDVYRSLYDPQQARSFLGNALRIFEGHEDRRGRASVSNNLGLSYIDTGEGREAIELFKTALQIRLLENDTENEIKTIANLAGAYDSIGDFHQALTFSEKALQRWRELKKTDKIPDSLNNVGFAYERLGRWQQAIDYYQEALASSGLSRSTEATALLNLGDLYDKLNDFSRALESYEKCLTILREFNNPGAEVNLLSHIGNVHISLNNLSAAVKYLDQARKIAETNPTLNIPRIQTYILLGIGEVYRRQGKLPEALNQFNEARKLAEAVGDGQQESPMPSRNSAKLIWRWVIGPGLRKASTKR